MGDETTRSNALVVVSTAPRRLDPGAHVGSYKIVRLLGAGGMGEVYLAADEQLRRQVAIKAVRPTVAGATTTIGFEGEALLGLGRLADAAERLERAVTLLEPASGLAHELAHCRLVLAQIIVRARGDRARARTLAGAARATLAAEGEHGRTGLALADALLARL